MNNEFPPLQLASPQSLRRRKERPRKPPLPEEIVARRAEIARILGIQVSSLSKALSAMSNDERQAMFYKIEHDQPIDVSGTGLKKMYAPGKNVTLVIPKEDNLDKLANKIDDFGGGDLRNGRPPNEDFGHITQFGPGDPKDRLSDELFDQYEMLCGQSWVICEIEVISLLQGKNQQRDEIAEILSELKASFSSGVHGTLFEHEEIKGTCRAVIRVTGNMFRNLVEDQSWQRKIAWFEPKPKFETFQSVWRDFDVAQVGISPPTDDAPVVCVVDSGITVGNPFLAPVTREDQLHSFLLEKPDNPYDEFGHGSGVASLAAYYALNLDKDGENRGKVWVAGARILNEHNQLEDERLFSKVIREVVEKFVEYGVKIFVLAVGDTAKTWNPKTKRTIPRKSWVARTLDDLSRNYDVVFVTCTGNIVLSEITEYLEDGISYPRYLAEEDACLLDPGQASLALTVGSIAPGTLVVSNPATAIAEPHGASPFTRTGPGIRGEVKPELVEYGGNLVHDKEGGWVTKNPGVDVVMASNQLSPAVTHQQGTSFAAPRVAHKLALVQRDLEDVLEQPTAALIKAFLVNSCVYRGEIASFQEEMDSVRPKHWQQILGYGFPSDLRATDCDDYSAVAYFQGDIEPDKVLFFDIPIPDELRASTQQKRITVTVVHMPQVQRWGLERYHGTDVKWRMFRGNVNQDEIIAAMARDEEESDDEAELPNELKFQYGIQQRSRGTIQHDIHEWTRHLEGYSENHYTLAIAAYERWGRTNPDEVPFAIVVRVEDTGRKAKVYSAISQALIELQIQAEART